METENLESEGYYMKTQSLHALNLLKTGLVFSNTKIQESQIKSQPIWLKQSN